MDDDSRTESFTNLDSSQVNADSESRSQINVASQSLENAPAICRICRGDGSGAEPLFHPCKCSGSIKFVHQECLMEWLSHSQKKYCELCKTSFRFTKLYNPDMPHSLPLQVFIEHMAKWFLAKVLLWLRAAVTVSVWVCWLPYFMRSVWSFMFWVSDRGLVGNSIFSVANESAKQFSWHQSQFSTLGTCPASPLFASTNTSLAEASAMLNEMKGEVMSDYLIRIILGPLGLPTGVKRSARGLEPFTKDPVTASATTSHSLLGSLELFRNLTRSPAANRTIITILEGQIITVLVIVCFILVILVRDYVVQQQPELNMRAAFEAPDENDDGLGAQENDANSMEEMEDDEGHTAVEVLQHTRNPPRQNDARGDEMTSTVHFKSPNLDERQEVILIEMSDGEDVRQTEVISSPVNDQIIEHTQQKVDWKSNDRRCYSGQLSAPNESIDATSVDFPQKQETAESPIPEAFSSKALPGRLQSVNHEFARSNSSLVPILNDARTSSTSPSPLVDAHAPFDLQKGKGRAVLPVAQASSSASASEIKSYCQRSLSEGQGSPTSLRPLGSNNWSLAASSSWKVNEAENLSNSLKSDADAAQPSDLNFPPPTSIVRETFNPNPVSSNGVELTPGHETANSQVPSTLDQTQADVSATGEDQRPHGFFERVTDFMWGDLNQQDVAILRVIPVTDGADAAAWPIPPQEDENDHDAEPDAQDAEFAANEADPEAVDDLEDFEGVLELVGMRGPVAGLFQNAIFCAVLVTVTIFGCIFIPYNLGRVTLWMLVNPMQIFRALFEFAKIVQDLIVMVGGIVSWIALNLLNIVSSLLGGTLDIKVVLARKSAWMLWTTAGKRVAEHAFSEFPLSASEMQSFSAVSHDALNKVKTSIVSVFHLFEIGCPSVLQVGGRTINWSMQIENLKNCLEHISNSFRSSFVPQSSHGSWMFDLSRDQVRSTGNMDITVWPNTDRFWAILAGYLSIILLSGLYLKRGSPFSKGTLLQAWEMGVIDTLHQASGILKVIIIIGIEMLVFPLYCGLLLDIALLPLFEDATMKSRTLFTFKYPLTSIFVHWFAGTGYMFHFALFVSMCRKIMRPGVLYFIRDPDDPEFHPVRDVLERNLATQLKKIMFSALVYGALVIVCLGGVVWGLAIAFPGVLPLHYSSDEPVLEFPVDLLFYNFLMPLAVKLFKPGDGLHAMYTWCFWTCARGLRLTHFLFGEREIDEEGTLQLKPASQRPYYFGQSMFLELNDENRVVPKDWHGLLFSIGQAKPDQPTSPRQERILQRRKQHLVASRQLTESGRFVRAPASDRVKISKNDQVFLPVLEQVEIEDSTNDDRVPSQYQIVYIPPHFRTRIFTFITLIWLFAAVTGIGFTIAPLEFGRYIFRTMIPDEIGTNDVYAFSIGIYILGTIKYSILRVQNILARVRVAMQAFGCELKSGQAGHRTIACLNRSGSLLYAYSVLVIFFPLVLSILVELYVTVPLHTYLDSRGITTLHSLTLDRTEAVSSCRHTICVAQLWTLGILYLHLGIRAIKSWFPDSRATTALRLIMRRGWLRPDANLLTKAFVLPAVFLATLAIVTPPLAASFFLQVRIFSSEVLHNLPQRNKVHNERNTCFLRLSYPAVALLVFAFKNLMALTGVFQAWKAGIRDEAYLVGERLHNFGAAMAGARQASRAWRNGRPRL